MHIRTLFFYALCSVVVFCASASFAHAQRYIHVDDIKEEPPFLIAFDEERCSAGNCAARVCINSRDRTLTCSTPTTPLIVFAPVSEAERLGEVTRSFRTRCNFTRAPVPGGRSSFAEYRTQVQLRNNLDTRESFLRVHLACLNYEPPAASVLHPTAAMPTTNSYDSAHQCIRGVAGWIVVNESMRSREYVAQGVCCEPELFMQGGFDAPLVATDVSDGAHACAPSLTAHALRRDDAPSAQPATHTDTQPDLMTSVRDTQNQPRAVVPESSSIPADTIRQIEATAVADTGLAQPPAEQPNTAFEAITAIAEDAPPAHEDPPVRATSDAASDERSRWNEPYTPAEEARAVAFDRIVFGGRTGITDMVEWWQGRGMAAQAEPIRESTETLPAPQPSLPTTDDSARTTPTMERLGLLSPSTHTPLFPDTREPQHTIPLYDADTPIRATLIYDVATAFDNPRFEITFGEHCGTTQCYATACLRTGGCAQPGEAVRITDTSVGSMFFSVAVGRFQTACRRARTDVPSTASRSALETTGRSVVNITITPIHDNTMRMQADAVCTNEEIRGSGGAVCPEGLIRWSHELPDGTALSGVCCAEEAGMPTVRALSEHCGATTNPALAAVSEDAQPYADRILRLAEHPSLGTLTLRSPEEASETSPAEEALADAQKAESEPYPDRILRVLRNPSLLFSDDSRRELSDTSAQESQTPATPARFSIFNPMRRSAEPVVSQGTAVPVEPVVRQPLPPLPPPPPASPPPPPSAPLTLPIPRDRPATPERLVPLLPSAALHANTLRDFYGAIDEPLPAVSERRATWEALGLGDGSAYRGSAAQNARLLAALQTGAHRDAPVPTPAPASPSPPSPSPAPPPPAPLTPPLPEPASVRTGTPLPTNALEAHSPAQFYAALNQPVPSRAVRRVLYEQLGLGSAASYRGSQAQNTALVEAMQRACILNGNELVCQ